MSTIVITLPPIPAVECLLAVIVCLLIKLVLQLKESISILRAMAASQRQEPSSLQMMESPRKQAGRDTTVDSPPPAVAKIERTIRTSAVNFQACLLGEDDVDVAQFMDACRSYGDKTLAPMGTWTLLTIREIHSNMDKVKHTYQLAPDRHRSMRALLEAEVASSMHQAGGLLTDPSAAMGLLWARRGLFFWIHLFASHLDDDPHLPVGGSSTPADSGYTDSVRAYEASLGPFNGWVSRNTFMLAARATPNWAQISTAIAPSYEMVLDDIVEWSKVVSAVLARMEAIHKTLDLEDLRKSI